MNHLHTLSHSSPNIILHTFHTSILITEIVLVHILHTSHSLCTCHSPHHSSHSAIVTQLSFPHTSLTHSLCTCHSPHDSSHSAIITHFLISTHITHYYTPVTHYTHCSLHSSHTSHMLHLSHILYSLGVCQY